MKRTFYIVSLLFFLTGILYSTQNYAQTQRFEVNGYVINSNTGNPLPDQKIIIIGDSTAPDGYLNDTVYSDGMGYFHDSIITNASPFVVYKVFTYDCEHNSLVYSFKGPNPENPYYFDVCATPNFNCHAEFSYTVSPLQPLKVYFDNQSFGADFFGWTFGDGDTSYYTDPIHVFSSPGTYNVKLFVWDNWPFFNCFDSISHTITLSFPEVDAHFEFTQNPYNPLEVNFQNQSNNNAHYYNWEFGDGTYSTEKNPYKKYNLPGNYEVKLTVFDELPVYHSVDSVKRTLAQDSNLFYNIGGQVFDGLFPINYGYAEIYRQQDQVLVFDESSDVNESGAYYFYKKYIGNYLVRAHDILTQPNPEFMPTYIGNSLFWQEAEAEIITGNYFSGDITLRQSIPTPSGPGLISGYLRRIDHGSNMQPAADVTVFLLDPSKKPYTVQYSNENGNFSFPNLAYGTYIVYPEITGKWTSPITVVLDSLHSLAEDLFFQVELSSVAAIGELPASSAPQLQMTFYPNPCHNIARLSVLSTEKQNGIISITDLTGHSLVIKPVTLNPGTNSFNLSLNDLKSGSYFVSIELNNKRTVKSFIRLND